MTDFNPNTLTINAIFDKKSKRYDTPFFASSDLFAKRRYLIMANEEKSPLQMWKNDFELHKLGTFDTGNGKCTNKPEVLLTGEQVPKMEVK